MSEGIILYILSIRGKKVRYHYLLHTDLDPMNGSVEIKYQGMFDVLWS